MTQLETIAAISVPTIVPTLAVVISILRSDAKIDSLSIRVDAKIDSLSTRVDAKIDALRSDLRGDMRVLEGIVYDHHGR